jgi:DNA replication and repair protein RecF
VDPLFVRSLQITKFRNLERVSIEPSQRFNVISGDNGQGKSNVLEALYCVLSSASFRTKSLETLRMQGQHEDPHVLARLEDLGLARTQTFTLRGTTRALAIEGKRPKSLVEYATRSPAVVFHPGELSLSTGPSSERRKLLDRVGLFLQPGLYTELAAYTRATRSRQKLLETSGERARELDDWEELMVVHGERVRTGRARVAAVLSEAALGVMQTLFPLACSLAYSPSAPAEREAFRTALVQNRTRDRVRKSAAVGPHKDDLRIDLAGLSARSTASQGQHRGIVLSLKAAEMRVIGMEKGVRPILLLDDVSSELDRDRTRSLFQFLQAVEGQVFLSTTRPDLIETAGAERRDFSVVSGRVT